MTGLNIHSALVVRYGTLVYGQYFVGEGQCLGESLGSIGFCSDTKRDLTSITKSVTSLLFGIDRKSIEDVDALLFDYFPEHADRRARERMAFTIC